MTTISNLKKNHANLLSETSNTINSLNKENIVADEVFIGPQITPLISIPTVNVQSAQCDGKSVAKKTFPDSPLLSTILKRTTTLEGYLEKTKKKLKRVISEGKEKDIEIIKLKEKIKLLEEEKHQKNCSCCLKTDFSEVLKMSQSLQLRINAIENFLKTDPYSWYKPDLQENEEYFRCSMENIEKPDLDLLFHQIKELNFEAGEIHICQKTKQGAAFQSCQSMSLTFFTNGMLLEGYPFRQYSDAMTQLFIKDILDGFFPSELQSEFPRGVLFNVCDKRNETYNEDGDFKSSVFKGLGCKLDSKPDDVDSKPLKIKKRHKPLQYEEFKSKKDKNNLYSAKYSSDGTSSTQVIELNKHLFKRRIGESKSERNSLISDGNGGGDCSYMYRQNNSKLILPDITIKDGQVCNNKKGTSKKYKQSSDRSCPRIKHLNTDANISDLAVQLKIRSFNDKDLYILTMPINEPIAKLRSYLPEDVKDCNIMHYKDSSSRMYLANDDFTLKDYGILKNSVLLLSKQKMGKE